MAEPPTEYERELRQLLVDWFKQSLSVIGEFGSSDEWPALIEDAKRRAGILGIPWDPSIVPDYVTDILAMHDE